MEVGIAVALVLLVAALCAIRPWTKSKEAKREGALFELCDPEEAGASFVKRREESLSFLKSELGMSNGKSSAALDLLPFEIIKTFSAREIEEKQLRKKE